MRRSSPFALVVGIVRGSAVALIPLTFATTGCVAWPLQETEPPIVGEPLSGSFYLTSDPQFAPHPVTIRIDEVGGPSGRDAQFAEGDEVVVNWSTLPLPRDKWIEVNGQDCDGAFEIRARFETDLLLFLSDGGCRIEVRGMRPEGNVQDLPPE